ncbi:ADP-ribosyltransferase [Streptomyces phage Stuff]|nr:ADP-ribosyltransferase [Streptomyces phage Stuff]
MGSQAPLGKGDLFKTPGAELPGFVREVARALMRNGKSKSQAIQIAIGQIKKWARGGEGVNADTVAKAQKALAQWEAAKAKARATPNKSDHSNPIYAPGQRVVFLANAPEGGKGKKAPAKKQARDGDKGSLPPGATGWKHGWIPVDDSGKAVGPAQKPKWLQDAEAKHKAAGGRSVEEINAEKLKNAQDARKRKAEAPAKKAKAEAERKKREAETAARKAKTAKEQKARETARKEKAAAREKDQKAKAKERQIQAAYRQAMTDRKNGRELSEQQRRVVAYVEAQQRKESGKLRRVDVPGADGSSVAKTAPAKKGAVPAPDAKVTARTGAKTAVAVAKKAAAAKKKAPVRVKAVSYAGGKRRNVTLSNGETLEGEVVYTNTLDFAGKFPKGQLAFRYKHGWILINPAIPSRGRMGGGIARQHGHKSGSVTHGHFEPKAGGGKKFVPERSGGENNPAKLKAAHLKGMKGAPADKSKYGLTAAQKDTGGNALKPTVPSAEKVSQVSKDANAASAKANASKSLHDAQVAAKKHADAFVQAKKAGDQKLADSHKANAQAWAKKAQQIKQAEKASADAKAKYEAEQKAKAKADAEKAEQAKLEAEKAAKAKKVAAMKKSAEEVQKAHELGQLAEKMSDKTPQNLTAKAQQHKYAADKYGDAQKTMEENGLPVSDDLKKAKAEQEQKAAGAAKAAIEKKKAIKEAQQLATDAYDKSDDASESQTAEDYQIAAHAHQKAGKAFAELGMTSEHTMHFDKASQLMKQHHKAKAEEEALAKMTGAPKAESKPDAMTPAVNEKSGAIGGVINDLPEDAGGSLAKWDDYLHAAYDAKQNPTPENLKKLKAATAALQADGASLTDIKAATSDLFKKAGFSKPAAKKTVAQKKSAATPPAKKTAAAPKKPEVDEDAPTPEMLKQWEITLPGPGMFKDGNAIMMLMNKPTTSPAQETAKKAAVQKALADFESKHKKAFDPNNVEVDLYQELHGSGPAVPQLAGEFFKAAEEAGFKHPDPHADATNGWKPPAHTKAALLGYTGEGSYSYVPINGQLRTVDPYGNPVAQTDPIKKRIKLMDEAFADAPPLPENIVTVRKMKNDGMFPKNPPPMKEGDEYVDYGYGSTSKSTSGWSGKVVMEVRIPAGTHVLDVNHNGIVSCSTSEQEILLPRGVRYKVISDTVTGGQRKIVTEVVNTGETHPKVKL